MVGDVLNFCYEVRNFDLLTVFEIADGTVVDVDDEDGFGVGQTMAWKHIIELSFV